MNRECGFELEVANNGGKVAELLAQAQAIPSPRLHNYHCHCEDCDYRNYRWLFAAQEDCTVSAEFVSKVLEFNGEREHRTTGTIAECLLEANAGLEYNSGMHVHVSMDGMTADAHRRLCRLFARYARTLALLAAGPRSAVRGYNGPRPAWRDGNSYDRGYGVGSWLSHHGETWEFRLWNASKMPWRIHLALGVSVAMVEAAIDGVEVKPPGPKGRKFSTILKPYWDAETEDSYWRQLTWKGHGPKRRAIDNTEDNGQ